MGVKHKVTCVIGVVLRLIYLEVVSIKSKLKLNDFLK